MDAILKELRAIKQATIIASKPTLTIHEAAWYLGVSEVSIYHHINEIRHYKPSKVIYIDKKDLDEWMHRNPVLSDADIDRKAAIYCDNR